MKKGFFILFVIGIAVFLAVIVGINLVIKSYEKEVTALSPVSQADKEEPINTHLDQRSLEPVSPRPQPQTKASGGSQEAPPAQKAEPQKEPPLPRGVPLVN